jgi:hypothetical protein
MRTYSHHPPVQTVSLALNKHDVAVFLTLGLGHESSFVKSRVKLLRLAILGGFGRVESLQAVLFQGTQQDVLRHPQTLVEIVQFFVIGADLIGRNGAQGTIEIVNGLEKISREALDAESTCGINVPLRALLQISEVRYGA